DGRDQRGLAGVGKADERRVGEQLELEPEPPFLAVFTLFGEVRRAAGVREEPSVALPALAASCRQPRIAVGHQVGEQLSLERPHGRAFGHVAREVLARLAVQLLAGAVRSGSGLAVGMVAEREQRRDIAVGAEPHVATIAAVATVRTALRYVRLTPE